MPIRRDPLLEFLQFAGFWTLLFFLLRQLGG
jgi:hypothetical protein